ncbi:olfactory receptor 1020-like [Rhinatrema bivittatum]|uniref:olfactory receptor 1020-like n=1 Tax=Rhinatrema bivittatum TaxID=194408 RepID=UPI00112D46EB|nr:olfactory receptor 1020-like [Rhinatrema bivittatum]
MWISNAYIQLKHFLLSKEVRADMNKGKTLMEGYCDKAHLLKGVISKLDTILNGALQHPVGHVKAREKGLGVSLTEGEWDARFLAVSRSSLAAEIVERSYNVLFRWYLTPYKLHKMGLKKDNLYIQLLSGEMRGRNVTSVAEFILLGFTELHNLQSFLFSMFLVIYILTLIGNISIIMIIKITHQLHTPMYFFISNLSFIDVCYSTTISPQTLVNLLLKTNNISFLGCVMQMYFFVTLAIAECFLLAVMACDRYVAICNPLLYPIVMNRRVCILLATSVYTISFVFSAIQTNNVFSMSFCGPNQIDNFYCDCPPLIKLSCSDIFINELVMSTISTLVVTVSITSVLLSYTCIISTILKIRSAEGRRKTFSTCASHFIGVTLFFGTLVVIYVIPSSHYSLNINRMLSVVYTMIIPMVNPIIYSLRNNDIKQALKKAWREMPLSSNEFSFYDYIKAKGNKLKNYFY